MTSTEAMIYQLKKLKGKPLKQKIEHILTYFWLPIVVFLVLVIALGAYIFHLATIKDIALSVTCINAFAESVDTETLISEFAQKAEIDLSEYDVRISADSMLSDTDPSAYYYASQKIAAQISAHSIDLLAADLETATDYFYQAIYRDLSQLLTPQQSMQYSEHFLYVDMAVVRLLMEEEIETIRFPDPQKPEEMEDPVPVALLLDGNSEFVAKFYPHSKGSVAIGVLFNSENLENVLAFLDFIMQ